VEIGTLIDAIVRQTTVLIAQLATSGGERTQLTNTANQLFVDLVRALREQGLGNKAIADMFGMALRTYHAKVQRLGESRTVRGRTLWQAVFEHVQARGPILRTQILERFAHDDAVTVRSVLRDLVDSAMLYRTGRGPSTRYQVSGAWDDDGSADAAQRLCHLVCMTVHRLAPASGEDVSQALSLSAQHLTPALEALVSDGRIRRTYGPDGSARYDGNGCVLPLGDSKGWEAAVFDHYQAMVSTLCAKLQQGRLSAGADDLLGGSTFGLRVWPQHPHYEEATTFLQRFRAESAQLRAKVAAYNQSHPIPSETTRVVIYGGQLLNDEHRENDNHEAE
jgi:predicted acetyltransferase